MSIKIGENTLDFIFKDQKANRFLSQDIKGKPLVGAFSYSKNFIELGFLHGRETYVFNDNSERPIKLQSFNAQPSLDLALK